nr:hypothetical protein [Tanacetum cinerariifolium]
SCNFEKIAQLVPELLSLTCDGFGFDLWAEIVPELDSLINGASIERELLDSAASTGAYIPYYVSVEKSYSYVKKKGMHKPNIRSDIVWGISHGGSDTLLSGSALANLSHYTVSHVGLDLVETGELCRRGFGYAIIVKGLRRAVWDNKGLCSFDEYPNDVMHRGFVTVGERASVAFVKA